MAENPREAERADETDVLVCPGCMAENEPDADFCTQCGCPLSTIATTDPLRRVYSQGYWFRTAASGRIRPIVFWGTWLLFGPAAVLGVVAIVEVISSALLGERLDVTAVLGIAVLGGIFAAICLLLYKMTRNYYGRGGEAANEPEARET